MTEPTPRHFKTLLTTIHRDAVRCALADHDAGRDGREPDQRAAALDLARECAESVDAPCDLAVGYWLRCYDRMAETVRDAPPPFLDGQRVFVTAGKHAGRLGTIEVGATPAMPTIALDPADGHERPLRIRPISPVTMTRWVQ